MNPNTESQHHIRSSAGLTFVMLCVSTCNHWKEYSFISSWTCPLVFTVYYFSAYPIRELLTALVSSTKNCSAHNILALNTQHGELKCVDHHYSRIQSAKKKKKKCFCELWVETQQQKNE